MFRYLKKNWNALSHAYISKTLDNGWIRCFESWSLNLFRSLKFEFS